MLAYREQADGYQEQIAIRKTQAAEELRRKVCAVEIGSTIKVKSRGGGIVHGTLVRVLEETAQVEVQLETGQKYWVPYDRVEFKETRPKLQENEYGKSVQSDTRRPVLNGSSNVQYQSERAHSISRDRSTPYPDQGPCRNETCCGHSEPSHGYAPAGAPSRHQCRSIATPR